MKGLASTSSWRFDQILLSAVAAFKTSPMAMLVYHSDLMKA